MKIRRDAPLAIVGAIGVAVAVLAYLSNRTFSAEMDRVESSMYDQMRAIVDFNLKGAEERALAGAELVARMPSVKAALAAQDRPRLLAETADLYRTQVERFGLEQAQFHLRPATSFLRLNAPEKFGDDLSGFRPLIVEVNKDQVARSGLSISRSGAGIFGVAPVFDPAGQPIGSFEMGRDFGPMLDKLKAAYGFDLTLFIKERPLREIATALDPASFDEHGRVGEFIKYRSTQWDLMHKLVSSEDLAAVDGVPVQFARQVGGVTYGTVLVSIRNPKGQPIGILAASKDFSPTRASAGRALVLQLAMGTFAVVLLAGIVIVVLRGFLLKPLGVLAAGLGALARGERGPELGPEEAPCEELQALAESYEQLRVRQDAAAPAGGNRDEVPSEVAA